MKIYHLTKKGQASLEYTIIFVAILVALLFMQVYIKQALSGRMRDTADDIASLYNPGGGTTIDTLLMLQEKTRKKETDLDRYENIYSENYRVKRAEKYRLTGAPRWQAGFLDDSGGPYERLEGTERVFLK